MVCYMKLCTNVFHGENRQSSSSWEIWESWLKKSKFCIELQMEWYLEKEKFLVSSESPKKQNKTKQTTKFPPMEIWYLAAFLCYFRVHLVI